MRKTIFFFELKKRSNSDINQTAQSSTGTTPTKGSRNMQRLLGLLPFRVERWRKMLGFLVASDDHQRVTSSNKLNRIDISKISAISFSRSFKIWKTSTSNQMNKVEIHLAFSKCAKPKRDCFY